MCMARGVLARTECACPSKRVPATSQSMAKVATDPLAMTPVRPERHLKVPSSRRLHREGMGGVAFVYGSRALSMSRIIVYVCVCVYVCVTHLVCAGSPDRTAGTTAPENEHGYLQARTMTNASRPTESCRASSVNYRSSDFKCSVNRRVAPVGELATSWAW